MKVWDRLTSRGAVIESMIIHIWHPSELSSGMNRFLNMRTGKIICNQ